MGEVIRASDNEDDFTMSKADLFAMRKAEATYDHSHGVGSFRALSRDTRFKLWKAQENDHV